MIACPLRVCWCDSANDALLGKAFDAVRSFGVDVTHCLCLWVWRAGYINDLVMESCPETCAPYRGMMEKKGKRWLLWEFLEGATLEDLLLECDEVCAVSRRLTSN